MGKDTKIEWAHHTWNPWVGCSKVSEACTHCYAESWAKRTGQPELWRYTRRRTSAAYWRQPHRWNAEAARDGMRRRVFCASLADVFEDGGDFPLGRGFDGWRQDLFDLIRETSALDWLLLTKRPENIARMLPADWGDGYANVWLGTTVENQARAEERIPHLLSVPARVRFLSCEPLLGALDLRRWIDPFHDHDPMLQPRPRISWVIVGGESGPGARPMRPDWPDSIREQCNAAGVAFFFKQWGEWTTPDQLSGTVWADLERADYGAAHTEAPIRIGKKRAGRELDGRTWDEVPR